MKFDSIGFDLDGTLWNSLNSVCEAWNKTSAEFGLEPNTYEEMCSVMGLNRMDLMTKLYPQLSDEDKIRFFEHASSLNDVILKQRGGVLYPNLESTLDKLYGKIPMYIVSNCQEGYIEAFLEFHKLGKYFDAFKCSGRSAAPKGENIKTLLKENGFTSSVYVGDTQGDRDAARLAGIPFIFAEYGFGSVDSFEYKITELTELPDIIL